MSKRKIASITTKLPADADVRHVLDSLRRVVRVLRLASREAEKRVGLSAAQLFVLQKLAEAKSLSVNEVAERTHTHQSSVSVVVQRLVERGFVSRQRSPQDARQMQLSVTADGRAALKSAPAAAQDQLIEALRQMSPGRVRQLSVNLQSMVDFLGIDRSEPAVMLFEDEGDSAKPLPKRRGKIGNSSSAARTQNQNIAPRTPRRQ